MKGSRFRRAWQAIVEVLSAEFLLTKFKHPNGGATILLRALISAIVLYGVALILKNAIDPARTWRPNFREARSEILATLPWFGAIFAAVYAALYARFAAQWSYLAGLYNQIKQTEASGSASPVSTEAIAQWKAGFIEDAEELHLAGKLLFAWVIRVWAEDHTVREAYEKHTIHGHERLERLLALVNDVCGDAPGGQPAAGPDVRGKGENVG
jgi:hypothetical protein